jgi:uncharacterized protein YdeI (YjbR/CyaY-like superfamily)
MSKLDEVAIVHPLSLEDWRAWLTENHGVSTGCWLATFKKATGQPRVEYDDAVAEALCWGWIDSVTRSLDEQRSLLYYSPRKKGSGWSRTNKLRLEVLIPAGRMQPAGMALVEAAKADGSWSKLDDVELGVVPADLASEFARYPLAAERFAAFPWSVRRGILEWIVQAKTPATRAKRIEETARLSQDNIRAAQWSPKEKR